MDYLQYYLNNNEREDDYYGFKPCYKWITFNTQSIHLESVLKQDIVLNLVINGLPSILTSICSFCLFTCSFKPCYKWITFNTLHGTKLLHCYSRGFKPCYKWITFNTFKEMIEQISGREF